MMVDLSPTIIAKSDQLNADDLLGGPITVTIQSVRAGNPDQPIAIGYEGDNGRPYYPCKSMRRVLVNVWGADGQSYVGKRLTLYRDPAVKFGGIAVGGIRISHMSGLTKDMPIALQIKRGSKALYTVKPLRETAQQAREQQVEQREDEPSAEQKWDAWINGRLAAIGRAATIDDLKKITSTEQYRKGMAALHEMKSPRAAELLRSASSRAEELSDTADQAPAEEHEDVPL